MKKGTKTEKVIFKYTHSKGWNTICVPFQLKSGSSFEHLTSIFGEGWSAYTLSKYENGILTFQNATPYSYSSINANTPLLVYAENASTNTDGVELTSNIIISYPTENAPASTTKNDATFQGTYAPISMEGKYGVTGNATIQKGGAGSNILGYRAYFTGVSGANGARPTIVFSEEEMPTGIGAVQMLENTQDVYNLNGQKVSQTHKGIYIVNGRKVVVK